MEETMKDKPMRDCSSLLEAVVYALENMDHVDCIGEDPRPDYCPKCQLGRAAVRDPRALLYVARSACLKEFRKFMWQPTVV